MRTRLDPSAVSVLLEPLETLTMVSAQLTRSSAPEMMTADPMRSVWSQASVSVLHHSLLTQLMEASARVHVRGISVVSMLTVLQPILPSVSARLDMEETPLEDVLTLMSVLVTPVDPVPGVSMRMEATSVSVPRAPEETPTWQDVLVHHLVLSAPMMKTVLVSLLVNSPPVSTPAPPSPVVTMLSVSRRIMLPGAGARWDTRRMLMASVPPCVMV